MPRLMTADNITHHLVPIKGDAICAYCGRAGMSISDQCPSAPGAAMLNSPKPITQKETA